MNYTINQLHIYSKVVEKKSITKAAEELHLTQPAVSIQLKKFQEQFDIPLIEIVGRKLFVTPFGKEIADVVEEILSALHMIESKTLAYKGMLSGTIKLSVVSTGKYVMPYFLTDFLRANPGVDLQMDVTNKNKVVESLDNNDVDFALVSILPQNMGVEYVDLLENKLFLIGNAEKTYSKKVNLNKLTANKPFIFRESGSGTRLTMEKFITDRNLEISKKIELTSNEAVKQAVIAGLGYSIMPIIGLKNELSNGQLHIIPTADLPITTTWRLIWLKGKKHLPAANALLEYIRGNTGTIIEEKFNWYIRFLKNLK